MVWLIMSVRSSRLRATLYSLPIPITVALVAGAQSESGGQFIGVPLLVSFMYSVAALEPRTGRIVAVGSSLLGYVAIAAVVHRWVALPSWVAFGVAALCLAAFQAYGRLHPSHRDEISTQVRPGLTEYAAVPLVTAGTWALGGILGPFLVTFPYSGVPTALAMRGGRMAFASHFANQAWLLLGFLGAFHLAQKYMSILGALGVAWIEFLTATACIYIARREGRGH